MINTTAFYVYCLNIPAELNQAVANENMIEKYDATDGPGYCYFDDELTIWRQNDDWYVAIHFNASSPNIRIKDCLWDAYTIICNYAGVSIWKRSFDLTPTLLFRNDRIY